MANAAKMFLNYEKKYWPEESEKNSPPTVKVVEEKHEPQESLQTKSDEVVMIHTAHPTMSIKVDVPKNQIVADKAKEQPVAEKPKKFSDLKKGERVVIHLYGKRKFVDYIGILEEDISYDKNNLPKKALIKITHAKDRKTIGKTLAFIYAQTGKKSRMAWILTRAVAQKKGKEIIEIIKKEYFCPFELERAA